MVCREMERIQSRFARKTSRGGAKGVLIGGDGSRDAGVTACRLNKALHVCRPTSMPSRLTLSCCHIM
ncbi:unnamed protein product, partial [Brenthis ino]